MRHLWPAPARASSLLWAALYLLLLDQTVMKPARVAGQLQVSKNCSVQLDAGGRLPGADSSAGPALVPRHYELLIDSDLKDPVFRGSVNITLFARARANRIVLHADSTLKILAVRLRRPGATPAGARLERACRDKRHQLLVLELAAPNAKELALAANSTSYLHLDFIGRFGDNLRGFYKSYQAAGANEVAPPAAGQPMASTQFESAEARRVFPCFDEPHLKATFGLTLIHSARLEALSNMDRLMERLLPGRALAGLAEPALSEQLLSFIGGGGGGSLDGSPGAESFGLRGALGELARAPSSLSDGQSESVDEEPSDSSGSDNENDTENDTDNDDDDDDDDDATAAAQAGRKVTQFARTPLMSTYLLAFAVGRFEFVERRILGGRLRLRVYAPPGRQHEGLFALDIAARAYPMLDRYFRAVEQPLRKLDLLAVPAFMTGAMENWGLITFREDQLLVDAHAPELEANRKQVALTVVHELVHQWFGNLVTMDWWNDIWLNEGFATWFEYALMEFVRPCAYSPLDYLVESHCYALHESEELAHRRRPLRLDAKLEGVAKLDDLYDSVSYNKGAAVVRLLHDEYLGPERFREAIIQYLLRHSYGNARTADLWTALESVHHPAGKAAPLRKWLDSWALQAGHPLVSARLADNGTRLELSQRPFAGAAAAAAAAAKEAPKNGSASPARLVAAEERWHIPVTVLVASGRRRQLIRHVFDAVNSTTISLPAWFSSSAVSSGSAGGPRAAAAAAAPSSPASSWLKINANFTGFYRVQYSDQLLELLEEPIRNASLPAADRLNILDDSLALWRANLSSVERFTRTLGWFEEESSMHLMQHLAEGYKELAQVLARAAAPAA